MINPFSAEQPSIKSRVVQVNRADVREYDALTGSTDNTANLSVLSNLSSINWFILLMVAIFGLIFGRLMFLQLVRGEYYLLKSDYNRVQTKIIPAPRGNIVDQSGKLLADNTANFVLTVTPADLPTDRSQADAIYDKLAATTKLDKTVIVAAVTNTKFRPSDPITILDNISYDQATKWMVELARLDGVALQALPTRFYPAGPATAAVLGYVGQVTKDDLANQPELNALNVIGKTGLEIIYDRQLAGQNGLYEIERDVRNQEQRQLNRTAPIPGYTLHTSISLGLQQQLYQALTTAIGKVNRQAGAAVAINPRNGEILALVSAPSFDNNLFVSSDRSDQRAAVLIDENLPLLNRVVAGQYPSGSIIKPFIATAALAEKIITPSTTVMSVGGFEVGHDFFPDWKSGGHGLTNVKKAIAESVNTFFYAIGGGYQQQTGLGVDRIVNYLQKFGWGTATGVDLPNEKSGFLPTKEWRQNSRPSPWKLGDTYHLSIGQGDLSVTPVQVANAIAAVANGGTLYQPHLVTKITDSNDQVISEYQSPPLNNLSSLTNSLSIVRQGMRDGVLSGSSRALQSLSVTAGAKTGTAQFGNEGKTHAWFAAFAPYENPEIVIVVLVEGGGEGSSTALPVAKDALAWYFANK